LISEVTEVALRFELIEPFHELTSKAVEGATYDRNVFLSWINLLKFAKTPWEQINEVFSKGFEKAKTAIEIEDLWKIFLFSSKSYGNIDAIKEVETRFLKKIDTKADTADTTLGKKKRKWDTAGEIKNEANSFEHTKKQQKV